MANTAGPYGLRPIGILSNRPYVHGVRLMKMTNSYGTSIFNGDVVKLVNTGTVEKDTGTTTATPVGVFLGCTYTDPNLGYRVFRNFWTASTSATDNFAYVCDDPDALFQIQADGTLAQTNVGNNIALVQGSGSTVTGMSAVAAQASSAATTNTLPLRIVDVVNSNAMPPNLDGWQDSFPDLIVTWNWGMHQYRTATGI